MNYGRRIIYTDAAEITAENVVDEVRKAYLVHSTNRSDTDTLYDVYRGKTNILQKEKEVRESINHKINENRAYEAVNFYLGYIFGEPIQYVRREKSDNSNQSDDALAASINALNGHMAVAGKPACDKKVGSWILNNGNGYRMTLPNDEWEPDCDEAPFKMFSLDPRQTFVVYSSDIEHRPMMGVYYVMRENNEKVFCVYTRNAYFEFTEFGTVSEQPHFLGLIPIVEYPADEARLGVFEPVMPILDALNELQSNRMDDIVQFVNSFLAIMGAQLDEETYKKLNDWKTLCLPEGTDAKYLSAPMSQSDVQTLKNDMVQAFYTITGVPNRNGGSSTSDTGSAVILRDGWQMAESHAKSIEAAFKEAEMLTLKLVLRILRDTEGTKLRITDIEPHFTRRNYENIASKAQVLTTMLNNGKIHPELAFAYCGMFVDSESAYLQSKVWWEENERKQEEKLKKEQERNANSGTGAVSGLQQNVGQSKGASAD